MGKIMIFQGNLNPATTRILSWLRPCPSKETDTLGRLDELAYQISSCGRCRLRPLVGSP